MLLCKFAMMLICEQWLLAFPTVIHLTELTWKCILKYIIQKFVVFQKHAWKIKFIQSKQMYIYNTFTSKKLWYRFALALLKIMYIKIAAFIPWHVFISKEGHNGTCICNLCKQIWALLWKTLYITPRHLLCILNELRIATLFLWCTLHNLF